MKVKTWLSRTVCIISILFLIIMNFNLPISKAKSIKDVITGVEGFEGAREEVTDDTVSGGMEIDQGDLKKMSDLVYNTLVIIGIVTMVIVGLVLGMKFMMGSIDQKAQIKETLIPYIVGCSVILGAFIIWKLVLTILNQME